MRLYFTKRLAPLFFAVACLLHLTCVAALAESWWMERLEEPLKPGVRFSECTFCPEMVVLPTGSFTMGAPLHESAEVYLFWFNAKPGKPVGVEAEGPEHQVVIDIPIAIGRNEVTLDEWWICVEEGGCSHKPSLRLATNIHRFVLSEPRHPVLNVSYQDILEYIDWLNKKTETNGYRLPTEAEWEYAAKAGSLTRYQQGDDLLPGQANVAFELNKEGGLYSPITDGKRYVSNPDDLGVPVTVDEMDTENAWGVRHMVGNALELTMSCWSERHIGLETSSSYLAEALRVAECDRVTKGGAFSASRFYARPANRGYAREESRSETTGFRLVRELGD